MQELRYESVDEVYEVLRKRKERTAIFAQEKTQVLGKQDGNVRMRRRRGREDVVSALW